MTRPIEVGLNKMVKEKRMFERWFAFGNWMIILFLFFIYFVYIIVCLEWILLGAIINPNYLLPYAAAVMTFLAFLGFKFNEFKQLINTSKKIIGGNLDSQNQENMTKVKAN